jgi:hypothetical protein
MNDASDGPLNVYLMLKAAAWARAVREDTMRCTMNGQQTGEHEVFSEDEAFEKHITCEFCGTRGTCGWCARCEKRSEDE